jgi:hypothetical protein
MGLKGRGRDESSDIESEREALRRQRLEAAAELASLKQALSERVARVQERERELTDALARVEKREQKLDAAEERGSRFDSVRLRLAEAKEGRTSLEERKKQLDEREQALAARESALAAGAPTPPSPVDEGREQALAERDADLERRQVDIAEREAAAERQRAELEQGQTERLRLDLQQHVHDHRALLLEGAGHGQPRMEALDHVGEHLLGGQLLEIWGSSDSHHTAHSPSPRMTW